LQMIWKGGIGGILDEGARRQPSGSTPKDFELWAGKWNEVAMIAFC